MRETAQVILRSHDLAIGACRTDGQQIAALGGVEVDLFGKDIGGLTDRSYDIVSLHRRIAADVLNLVVCLIEGRTDEIGETGINDGKLLEGSFFHIERACDERAAF